MPNEPISSTMCAVADAPESRRQCFETQRGPMLRAAFTFAVATFAVALIPAPVALAQGFAGSVTNHRKLSMLEGGLSAILPGPGLFGVAVCDIGDLNLDGTPDIMVGAYVDSEFVEHAGAMYVLFMRPNGTVKSHVKIGSEAGGFNVKLDPYDMFGWSIANMGDLDGDGVIDVAVGAWLDDEFPYFDQGAIYILFMKKDGTVKSSQRITTGGVGGFTSQLYHGNRFGTSLTNMGDVNGDGVNDLLAGAIYDHDAAYLGGAAFMLFMNSNGTVKSYQKISMGQGGFFTVLDQDERFGYASTNLGDLDGDGVNEAAVSAFLDNDSGVEAGSVYILFFGPDGYVKHFTEINSVSGNFAGTIAEQDCFGASVARLPDLDGNGVPELAVGAVGDDHGGDLRGSTYILFLNADGTVHGHTKIGSGLAGFEGILEDGDRFGQAACSLGDFDHNGTIELAIGADHDDDGFDDAGAVWILSLTPSPWVNMQHATKAPNPPQLAASGQPTAGATVTLDVTNGLPNAPVMLVLSTGEANLPIGESICVPSLLPPVVTFITTLDSNGALSLGGTWPSGVPAGWNIYCQVIVDGIEGDPDRIVVSNAIRGVPY
jgi:FG-GAP-like repeat